MTPEEIMARCPCIFPREPVCGFDCPPGWLSLIERMCVELEEEARSMADPPVVEQIKSKFGKARCYVSGHTPEIDTIIRRAEVESGRTCEECGAPGRTRSKGPGSWLWTLCVACAEAKGYPL